MNDKTPMQYENHTDEWREEENEQRWEREHTRKQVDPRDPSYISEDTEDE